jgi:hypothetical protein
MFNHTDMDMDTAMGMAGMVEVTEEWAELT